MFFIWTAKEEDGISLQYLCLKLNHRGTRILFYLKGRDNYLKLTRNLYWVLLLTNVHDNNLSEITPSSNDFMHSISFYFLIAEMRKRDDQKTESGRFLLPPVSLPPAEAAERLGLLTWGQFCSCQRVFVKVFCFFGREISVKRCGGDGSLTGGSAVCVHQ